MKKPNQFISEFQLDKGKPLTNAFRDAFNLEFNELLVVNSGLGTLFRFEAVVRIMRQKFDSIRMKTANTFVNEKAWNWFYATHICPKRLSLFPDEMAARRKLYA